jgi:hypothetical protein
LCMKKSVENNNNNNNQLLEIINRIHGKVSKITMVS